MTKVYIVTNGSYSDYHICAVCSTEPLAEEARKIYGYDGATDETNVVEWEIDKLPEHPPGTMLYRVVMHADTGQVVWERTRRESYDDVRHSDEFKCGWSPLYWIEGCVAFYVWATDEHHAVKVAHERRLRLKAAGHLTTDYVKWGKYVAAMENTNDQSN